MHAFRSVTLLLMPAQPALYRPKPGALGCDQPQAKSPLVKSLLLEAAAADCAPLACGTRTVVECSSLADVEAVCIQPARVGKYR